MAFVHQKERIRRAALAEDAVAEWLSSRGFSIVARNLRLGYLELDIVARQGSLVIVVEVRQRAAQSYTTGFGSIGYAKQRRIRWGASRLWARRYASDPSVSRLRLDAASVTFDGETVHIEYCAGAF